MLSKISYVFVPWFTVSARDTFIFCLMGLVVSEILGFLSKGVSLFSCITYTCVKNLLLYISLQ